MGKAGFKASNAFRLAGVLLLRQDVAPPASKATGAARPHPVVSGGGVVLFKTDFLGYTLI